MWWRFGQTQTNVAKQRYTLNWISPSGTYMNSIDEYWSSCTLNYVKHFQNYSHPHLYTMLKWKWQNSQVEFQCLGNGAWCVWLMSAIEPSCNGSTGSTPLLFYTLSRTPSVLSGWKESCIKFERKTVISKSNSMRLFWKILRFFEKEVRNDN